MIPARPTTLEPAKKTVWAQTLPVLPFKLLTRSALTTVPIMTNAFAVPTSKPVPFPNTASVKPAAVNMILVSAMWTRPAGMRAIPTPVLPGRSSKSRPAALMTVLTEYAAPKNAPTIRQPPAPAPIPAMTAADTVATNAVTTPVRLIPPRLIKGLILTPPAAATAVINATARAARLRTTPARRPDRRSAEPATAAPTPVRGDRLR